METKLLYKDHIWEAIAAHPQYDLGQRELAALLRFLPVVTVHTPENLDVLHLASSTGREVPAIVSVLPGIKNYLLNDIVLEVVECSRQKLQLQFPGIVFLSIVADIEYPGIIAKLRKQLSRPILIILVANGVIFSNRRMDSNIHEAMREDDLFLLTVEKLHSTMFDSYLITPIFELLSESGREVYADNIQVWYDDQASEMHMACEGEDLLVSYKPTAEQLYQRMTNAGFEQVAFEHYSDLHMLAGLYQKGNE